MTGLVRAFRCGIPASVVLLLLLLAGCATVPYMRLRPTPEWVLEPPVSTDDHEYFVAAGTDPGGDIEAAEDAAAASLLTRINQALGVDVSVLTTAEARSTLDSFESSVREQVTQSGAGRVAGLRIVDRYLVDQDGRVTVHLLGRYERSAFEAERAERRSLLAARQALFLEPERRADAQAQTGSIGAAVQGYLQAATAAARAVEESRAALPGRDIAPARGADPSRDASARDSGVGLRRAPIVLERALAKAIELASGITISARSGPERVEVGSAPGEPVRFVVTGPNGSPASGLPLEIAYPQVRGDRTVVGRVTVRTDNDGIARVDLPVIELVGDIEVYARIHASVYLELLGGLPDDVKARRVALETALTRPRAEWRVRSYSRAREIPTTLMVVETDATGARMPSGHTTDGLAQVLTQAGFRLVASGSPAATQVVRSQSDMIRHLQNTAPPEARRAVFGTATIVDFTEADGYMAKVRATVTVVDLNSEEILYTTSAVKNARSASADQALTTAFHQLGRTLGERLASRLP